MVQHYRDEPNERNIGAVAAVCKLIKRANPKVNIYVNPCFWKGFDNQAVSSDKIVSDALGDWYNRYVDISMPLFLLLRSHPNSWRDFTAKRMVNAYYYVSGHLDRSESAAEINKYRRMAWNSFRWGMNGWAFYSYYSPRACAWDHFDRNPAGEGLREPNDYQLVYPGIRSVIATRQSEALREGYEDWKLLNLLKQQGRQTVLDNIIKQYEQGIPITRLREQALRAVVNKQPKTQP